MAEKKGIAEDLILIGHKQFMGYVQAITLCFTAKNLKQVTIKARGRFTGKAIDISEACKNILKKQNITITTEEVSLSSLKVTERETQKERQVSQIEIVLAKK